MPTPIFGIPEIQESQAGKYFTHNEAIAQLEALFTRVWSKSNGGPPDSKSEGDTYVVDNVSGEWIDSNLNDIAYYYSGTWYFIPPVEGLSTWCVDEQGRIYFDGSLWQLDFTSRVTLNANLNDQDAVGVVDTLNITSNEYGFGAGLTFNVSGELEETYINSQSTMPCSCLALGSGTGSGEVLFWGRIRNDAWNFSVGDYIYAGNSGELVDENGKPSVAGELVQVVGTAMASNKIFFNPSYVTVELGKLIVE